MRVTKPKAKIIKLSIFAIVALALSQPVFSQQIVTPEKAAPTTVANTEAATQIVAASSGQEKIKVVFDYANPGVVYVEANGERVRVDVNKKTVEPAAMPFVASAATDEAGPAAAVPPVDESAYSFGEGEEPYDARLINVPTPKKV